MTNAHKGYRFLRLHTIAKLGYVVVVMDCRGSGHRGLQFEGHIKNRLVGIANLHYFINALLRCIDFCGYGFYCCFAVLNYLLKMLYFSGSS